MGELIFFGAFGGLLFLSANYEFNFNSKRKLPKLSDFNIYSRFEFEEYFLKLNDEIMDISKKYDEKIDIIKSEIELLPNDEEFIEFKRLKENMLKEIENKKELEIIKYISNIRNKIPTLVVVSNSHFPVKNKDVIKYYSNLSKKEFNNSNIAFIDENTIMQIINEFYNIFYSKLKYFKKFFKIIDVKTKINFEKNYNLVDIKRIGE